jgi:hypothetical protein
MIIINELITFINDIMGIISIQYNIEQRDSICKKVVFQKSSIYKKVVYTKRYVNTKGM